MEWAYGDELELRVEKLVEGGAGLARHEGLPVFVSRSAPGDLVRATITDVRRSYLRAEVLEVVEPGAGRRDPPCPHFADCGGCDLQHLDEDTQVRCKEAAVRETLARLGGIELDQPLPVRTASPLGYRVRTGVRIEPRAEGYTVGYRARRSRRQVPIDSCVVLAPELERAVLELPGRLPAAGAPERLDLALGDDGKISSAPVVEGMEHGEVARTIGSFTYRFDARCFFQAHADLLPELVDSVVGPERGRTAWDLYSGVGLFSVPLATRFEAVRAVESNSIAARYARINARRNRLPNLEVVGGAVDSHWTELPEGLDRVVLDPPRAGLSPAGVEALRNRRPERITYVSCHTAALARDLKALTPGYRIVDLTLFDLFPQTGHIEIVAQLAAGDG